MCLIFSCSSKTEEVEEVEVNTNIENIDVFTTEIELGNKPTQYSRIIHDGDTLFVFQTRSGSDLEIIIK